MSTTDATGLERDIQQLEAEIEARREKLVALRRQLPEEPIEDHVLQGPDGPVTLSSLFGDRDELIVIHNMGSSCAWCTLWADGFNGVLAHLESRAAFVVVSPDEPATQKAFAAQRGWRFRMASSSGSGFTRALGFEYDENGERMVMPGMSALRKAPDGTIHRSGKASFGPGDDFCAVWHMFDLLPAGTDWRPRFRY